MATNAPGGPFGDVNPTDFGALDDYIRQTARDEVRHAGKKSDPQVTFGGSAADQVDVRKNRHYARGKGGLMPVIYSKQLIDPDWEVKGSTVWDVTMRIVSPGGFSGAKAHKDQIPFPIMGCLLLPGEFQLSPGAIWKLLEKEDTSMDGDQFEYAAGDQGLLLPLSPCWRYEVETTVVDGVVYPVLKKIWDWNGTYSMPDLHISGIFRTREVWIYALVLGSPKWGRVQLEIIANTVGHHTKR